MSAVIVPALPKQSDSFGFMPERKRLLDELTQYVPHDFMKRLSLFVPQEQWALAAEQAGFIREQARV